jgi:hypothetical protein
VTAPTSKIVQPGKKQAVLLLAIEEGASHMPQKTIAINQEVNNVQILGGFIPPKDCI